ncbi:acetamidase/formamidase family protein [Roseomonas sp. BN140053]|uniref:acetamidase/formamidase family protein n=1 Tax=Roseomonas sp. BN140053 TaxID=3391898 RepID=UPI0039EA5E1C
MALHRIDATPETVRIGTFDAEYPAVATVNSGDTVLLECVSGRAAVLPPPGSGMTVPEALRRVLDADLPGVGHILTGPVAVAGAAPGDMLEVRIEAVEPGADWGYNGFRPLAGTLPHDFEEAAMIRIAVDRERGVATLPWGTELPMSPFFGVMGVAPPPSWGRISTKEPRAHGGNLDNKELTAGSTLFLPVHVEGAMFSAGDGHGMQGDGEVCVTALEMCLNGTFTLVLHKGGGARDPVLRMPRAETPTHFISMGLDEDLDQAMRQAVREMIGFICARTNLSRAEAYQFCSLAVDFHVTQTVNGEKGVHGLLRKGLLF